MTKYFKPKSLTWWAGISSLSAGVVVAVSSSFGVLEPVGSFINALTGDIAPSIMVLYGLTAIGLRGAL